MNIFQDKDAVRDAYEDVRSDSSDTTWLICRYEGKQVFVSNTGGDLEKCFSQLTDDERAFVYIRLETGDEMSRRAKFAFISWIGPDVSTLKKAKISTDKGFVKAVLVNFAKEFLIDSRNELDLAKIEEGVRKSGGANYGTGNR